MPPSTPYSACPSPPSACPAPHFPPACQCAPQLPKRWKDGDTLLLDLLPFLEAVVRSQVPDVRDVVRSYDGQDIPTAFRERMKQVAEKRQQQQQQPKGFLGGIARR